MSTHRTAPCLNYAVNRPPTRNGGEALPRHKTSLPPAFNPHATQSRTMKDRLGIQPPPPSPPLDTFTRKKPPGRPSQISSTGPTVVQNHLASTPAFPAQPSQTHGAVASNCKLPSLPRGQRTKRRKDLPRKQIWLIRLNNNFVDDSKSPV